jgi:hypothetical protein
MWIGAFGAKKVDLDPMSGPGSATGSPVFATPGPIKGLELSCA